MPIDFEDLLKEGGPDPFKPTPGIAPGVGAVPGKSEVFGGEFRDRLIDDLLKTPEILGDLSANFLSAPVAGSRTLPSIPGLIQQSQGPLDAFSNIKEEFSQQNEFEKTRFPASTFANVPPLGDALGLQAGVTGQDREDVLEQRMQRFDEHPGLANLGRAAADAAFILGTRSPRQIAAKNRGVSPDRFIRRDLDDLSPGQAKFLERGQLSNLFKFDTYKNTNTVKFLEREGIRVAEVGLDGALIAALNDGDPVEGAMIGAGFQAGGSMLLSLSGTRALFSGKPLKAVATLGVNSLMAANIIQMLKTVTPGGKDFILPSVESGYAKVMALAALGVAAGLAGSGRVGQGIMRQNGPVIADAVTNMPRSTILSLWEDARDNPEGKSLAVVQKAAEDPEFFGPTATRRINRAYEVGGDLPEIIDNLAKTDRKFRLKLESLEPVRLFDTPEAAADRTLSTLPAIEQEDPRAVASRSLANLPSFGL